MGYFHPADVDSGPFYFDLSPDDDSISITPKGEGNTPNADPCAGQKGQLNFISPPNKNWGIQHITDRHIDKTQNVTASKYLFHVWEDTLNSQQEEVMGLDQLTFEKGVAIRQGDRTVYIYAFASFDNGIIWGFWVVGRDMRSNNPAGIPGLRTNVNTLVVAADCKTVITSFPGLPGNISPFDPRITPLNPVWGRGWSTKPD